MRLHLDAADRAVAEDLFATGVFAGVTTSPMSPWHGSPGRRGASVAAAGATYIAPYAGGLHDTGRDGLADAVSPARRTVDRFTTGPAVAERFFPDALTRATVRTFGDAAREGAA
ncbi:hypothetical protein [Streptomyces adonidis]|uniref:hypothetical protein n=1 Tax=Streptomyces adonidis TaxID=3231367 RepID=UPI0034DAC1D9